MSILTDKISQIDKFLEELENFIPSSYEEYKDDIAKKAICERYFEKIVEALVDLAFIIIKLKKLRIPKDDSDTFFVLNEKNIIPIILATKLKEAKGMRNIIAHEYGKIDDELVFEAVSNELIGDAEEFIKLVRNIK